MKRSLFSFAMAYGVFVYPTPYLSGMNYQENYKSNNLKNISISEITHPKKHKIIRYWLSDVMLSPTIIVYKNILTEVNLPNTVNVLIRCGFRECMNLINVRIPDSVYCIRRRCFDGCISLTDIELPSSVKIISEHCFNNCYNLINVKLSNSLETIAEWAFCNCKKLEQIELPNSLTSISKGAFMNGTGLTKITIPSNIQIISRKCFAYCENLKEIVFKSDSKLQTIDFKSFYNTGLTKITIPDTTANIRSEAFANCKNLELIFFTNNSQLKSIFSNALMNDNSLNGIAILSPKNHQNDEVYRILHKKFKRLSIIRISEQEYAKYGAEFLFFREGLREMCISDLILNQLDTKNISSLKRQAKNRILEHDHIENEYTNDNAEQKNISTHFIDDQIDNVMLNILWSNFRFIGSKNNNHGTCLHLLFGLKNPLHIKCEQKISESNQYTIEGTGYTQSIMMILIFSKSNLGLITAYPECKAVVNEDNKTLMIESVCVDKINKRVLTSQDQKAVLEMFKNDYQTSNAKKQKKSSKSSKSLVKSTIKMPSTQQTKNQQNRSSTSSYQNTRTTSKIPQPKALTTNVNRRTDNTNKSTKK